MKQFNIKIESELEQQFRQKVKENGQTMSHVLRSFIKAFVTEDLKETNYSHPLLFSLIEEIQDLKLKIMNLENRNYKE